MARHVNSDIAMRCPLVLVPTLLLAGCGMPASPVADYVDAVEVELYSDGTDAFLRVRLTFAKAPGCPDFGAPATIDGREMEPFEFGGHNWGVALDAPNDPPCSAGAYRLPVARSAEPKTSKVRIADKTGEITFTIVDVLTEPALQWISASELPPGGYAQLRVTPDSLSFMDNQSILISGLDPSSGRDFSARAFAHGTHLSFSVPDDAPPGTGQLHLQDPGRRQLSAPVLECSGATRCTGTLQFSKTARTPIAVLTP